MGKLTGRTALVTGGSGGIGAAITRALATEGASIAVSYVGFQAGAENMVAELEASGTKALAVHLDQRDPNSISTCIDNVAATFSGLDILVNNAAWNIGIPFPDLDSLTNDIWDRIMETNVRGPFLLAKGAAEHLRRNKGHIVNIASVGGIYPGSSSIAYSTSKAGLIHLTRCLAVALAPDVAVNCIAPGLVEGTRMAENVPDPVAEAVRKQTVLGRVGDADDIGRQTLAFATSTSISGQVVSIDGGMPGAMR